MTNGTLFMVMIDVEPQSIEDEFNAWYNDEHVPELLRVPGFLTGQRFRAIAGEPRYAALYDLADVSALNEPLFHQARPAHPKSTPATRKMWAHVRNLRRGIYNRIARNAVGSGSASHLLLTGFDLDPGGETKFRNWWTKEHLPALVDVRDLRGAEYYVRDSRSTDHKDPPGNALALYRLANAQSGREAKWLAGLPVPVSTRVLYECIYPV